MIKILSMICALSFLFFVGSLHASTIELSAGDVITVEPNVATSVACLASSDSSNKNYCAITSQFQGGRVFIYTLRIHHYNSNNVVRILGQFDSERGALDRMKEAQGYGWCL